MGPGLSQDGDTSQLVVEVISKVQNVDKMVIDADGLNAIAGRNILPFKKNNQEIILTPHLGEMSRLTGLKIDEIIDFPVEVAKKYAKMWECVLVLKGATTIIASPDERVYINTTGNKGLATAGTGDVLAGMIAGFCVQGIGALEAAICGVYFHGRCADIVKENIGSQSLKAQDLLTVIPIVIKSFL